MIKINLVTICNNLLSIFDAEAFIRNGGLLLVFLFVYGSTGLFFCFFIPVGAILFTTGILIASGGLEYDIYIFCFVLILASVLGNLTGYWFGRKAGPILFKREDSRFFKKRHLISADLFYKKYGWLALTLGLYLPIIRTFASIIAGIVRLKFRRFVFLVFSGSVVWIVSFVSAGFFIGSRPYLKPWLNHIVIAFLLIVTIPLFIWVFKELRVKKSK